MRGLAVISLASAVAMGIVSACGSSSTSSDPFPAGTATNQPGGPCCEVAATPPVCSQGFGGRKSSQGTCPMRTGDTHPDHRAMGWVKETFDGCQRWVTPPEAGTIQCNGTTPLIDASDIPDTGPADAPAEGG